MPLLKIVFWSLLIFHVNLDYKERNDIIKNKE